MRLNKIESGKQKIQDLELQKSLIKEIRFPTPDLIREKEKITKELGKAENELLSGKRKKEFERFAKRDKRYALTAEAIRRWKKDNSIEYNPDEIYSRDHKIYSFIGRVRRVDTKDYLQSLLDNLQLIYSVGDELIVSALTKSEGEKSKYIEGAKAKSVWFEIYPLSEDIEWASNTDVASSRVQNSSRDLIKEPISFTKAPSTDKIHKIKPELVSVVENIEGTHNELGIRLKLDNFKIGYEDSVDEKLKKVIDEINIKLNKVRELQIPDHYTEPVGERSELSTGIESYYNGLLNDLSFDHTRKSKLARKIVLRRLFPDIYK
ncbi:MAG: hypothetical protein U9R00_02880 [Patescibacteria group bacterium]|nr:hypothetical protein [Patescibacteria group bacterium]